MNENTSLLKGKYDDLEYTFEDYLQQIKITKIDFTIQTLLTGGISGGLALREFQKRKQQFDENKKLMNSRLPQ